MRTILGSYRDAFPACSAHHLDTPIQVGRSGGESNLEGDPERALALGGFIPWGLPWAIPTATPDFQAEIEVARGESCNLCKPLSCASVLLVAKKRQSQVGPLLIKGLRGD